MFIRSATVFVRPAAVFARPATVFVGPVTVPMLARALFGAVALSAFFPPRFFALLAFRSVSVVVPCATVLFLTAIARFLFLALLSAFLLMLGEGGSDGHERQRTAGSNQQG